MLSIRIATKEIREMLDVDVIADSADAVIYHVVFD